jgi:hypothetical protein
MPVDIPESVVDPFFSSPFSLSSLELSDTKVYEPEVRAILGTALHFCEVVEFPESTVLCSLSRVKSFLKVQSLSEVAVLLFSS